MNKAIASACAVALLAGAQATRACDRSAKVIEVMIDTVAVYDADGNLQGEVDKSVIVPGQTIVSCKDTPALVEVHLKSNDTIKTPTGWVNRLEVKVGNGDKLAKRECKREALTRVADASAPATSGIDPCTPAKPQ